MAAGASTNLGSSAYYFTTRPRYFLFPTDVSVFELEILYGFYQILVSTFFSASLIHLSCTRTVFNIDKKLLF